MGISAKPSEILFNQFNKSFFKIGAAAKSDVFSMLDFQNSKKEKLENLWCTLGWRDDRPLTTTGKLEFSKNGNVNHRGVTAELASLIAAQNPDVSDVSEVTERFIDLSDVKFQNLPQFIENEEEIHLRLELFLEKDEGALVYLQDNPKGIMNSKYSLVNFITPEATPKHSQDRTSLTYFFPYAFGRELEFVNDQVVLTKVPKMMSTVIKVLTFVRKPLSPEKTFQQASKKLNEHAKDLVQDGISNFVGDKKNKLVLFNKAVSTENPGGKFEYLDGNARINPNLKTLLLIHGTFSTIEKSYGELCDPSISEGMQKFSPLQKILQSTDFEQVIGFEHPTASQSVDDNVKNFHELMLGLTFSKPVSIITSSRGALVGESIICHTKTSEFFTVDKMMTFAPAHGSDLLTLGKGIDRFLSLLRNLTTTTGWGYAIALAQFSFDAILTQPGLNDMVPDSAKIKSLESMVPNHPVQIQAMVGDFDKTLVSKKFVRIAAVGFDALIRLAFKSETDWVIGCPEQRFEIHDPKATYKPTFEMYCTHGKQFDVTHPKKDGKTVDMTSEIIRFFNL